MTAFSQRKPGMMPARSLAAFGAALGVASSLAGCGLLAGPPKADPPQVFQKPTAVFDPADNLTPGRKLPDLYRVTNVLSGELMTIQGVKTVTKGTVQSKEYGVPETVRLAGIVAPAPAQPGWNETVQKVRSWLDGKEDLQVEGDDKFPIDLDSHRMVQIYFTPGPAPKNGVANPSSSGTRWNLNRMLVHTGYAVVDLFGATSIDVQKWLNDEEFAKNYVDPKTNSVKPLGLWALGIVIPQRGAPVPAPGTATTPVTTGTPGVIGATAKAVTKTTLNTTTKTSATRVTTTQSSTRNAPVLPKAAPARTAEPLPTPR